MRALIVILSLCLIACGEENTPDKQKESSGLDIVGTWELVSSQKVQEGKTTKDDLTSKRMIKIINQTHFSFLNHDLEGDSLSFFVAGGGSYTLNGNSYTEYLEYCNYREWEGNDFNFSLELKGDTLIQKGIEKIEDLGVEREITEKYLKTEY